MLGMAIVLVPSSFVLRVEVGNFGDSSSYSYVSANFSGEKFLKLGLTSKSATYIGLTTPDYLKEEDMEVALFSLLFSDKLETCA